MHSFLGSLVRGMVVVQEGNISLSLEDSNGNVIIAEREVDGGYSFEFQATGAPSFVLLLDNRNSSVEKRVYWTVWTYFYGILSLLYGLGVSVVGSIAVLRESMTNARVEEELQDVDVSLEPIDVGLVKTGSSIQRTVQRHIADYVELGEGDAVTVCASDGGREGLDNTSRSEDSVAGIWKDWVAS